MEIVRSERAEQELSVSQVTRRVKELVEGAADLQGVWVRGEVSNVRLAGSGHLYFTLKDELAQLRVAYFGFARGKRRPPEDGSAVLVHGDVRVYERAGEYQLVADDIIKAGVGDLAARFEALKKKLEAEGLFDAERKVAPPLVPRVLAVVTGIATAALQDVLNVLRRRAPYARVVIFPAPVQGDTAPPELIAALEAADACPEVEVILLVRGGGSLEDLWCFNDERLARALAGIERPVITGVGHEVDFTIVDFIADRRAPTPSAAAELAAPDAAELRAALDTRSARILRDMLRRLEAGSQGLERLFDRRLLRDVAGVVDTRAQELDALTDRLIAPAVERSGLAAAGAAAPLSPEAALLGRMLAPLTRRLDDYARLAPRSGDDLLRATQHRMREALAQLAALSGALTARDPRAPKKQGWALVWKQDGTLVRSPQQVEAGEALRLEVQQGEIAARVDGVDRRDGPD